MPLMTSYTKNNVTLIYVKNRVKSLTREICVCAQLAQTRYVQKKVSRKEDYYESIKHRFIKY